MADDTSTASRAPSHWTCDVVLVDGGTVHVRPIRPEDATALIEFHGRLSPESQYFRFFTPKPTLPEKTATHLANVDHVDRVALVVELGDQIVGVARYDREPDPDQAEVAFVVADEHQGRGIGTALLEHLAGAARERGITRFVADTLPHNRKMLGVFRAAGFDEHSRFDNGVIRVEMFIEPTEESRSAAEGREHRAEAASVARVLIPRSVAVIGASRTPASVGHQVLRNLLAGEFAGPVYPVNPGASHVASVKAYPTVLDVPDRVDLAVIAVPAPAVADVVRQCATKGVAGLVVLSAGFSEIGPSGATAQAELRDLVRRNGMRLIGPNCIGIANTAVGLNATFSSYPPIPGRLAMQSQSGAIGIGILDETARLGLGVSTFVSVGNKADISGNDLLQYWEDDPNTDVVLLYLESFGNPRKFGRIARRVSRRKPIVAVKSGRTSAGVRAASSHTAAMASPDAAVDALFAQTGVIRVDTLDEMLDMALVLGSQPLPRGPNVVILGNSGGPGILASDACAAAGLEIPELAEPTQAALREFVDPNAAVSNPVDLVASAGPEVYERALRVVLTDDGIDAAIVICTRTFAADPAVIADVVGAAAAGSDKPVTGCFIAWPDLKPLLGSGGGGEVPAFASPEPAARALARAARYAEWRRRPPGSLPALDGFDPGRVQGLVGGFLADHPEGGWLSMASTGELLDAAGIPAVASVDVSDPDQASTAAEEIGLPVALKASGPDLVHKSDVGGVRLGLRSASEVADAYRDMRDRIGPAMTGAVVQPMAETGVETIVGVVQDPLFGPLVLFGLGGVTTELLGDQALRILPLTDVDAAETIRSLRSSPLLFGYRGAPPVDAAALEDLLQRVARLAGAVPEVSELDLNPVIVTPAGAIAVDARVLVRPATPGPAQDLRQMS